MTEVNNISELNIHDSVLIQTNIRNDSVEMTLEYIDDYDLQTSSVRKLVFEQCRRVEFRLNPGYDSPNSLLDAEERRIETGRNVRIETNTTAGVIEIECANIFLSESLAQ